jgi:hypothetical protein
VNEEKGPKASQAEKVAVPKCTHITSNMKAKFRAPECNSAKQLYRGTMRGKIEFGPVWRTLHYEELHNFVIILSPPSPPVL